MWPILLNFFFILYYLFFFFFGFLFIIIFLFKIYHKNLQSKLNCEVLYDDLAFEVRWAVAGESVVVQLVAKLGKFKYSISFQIKDFSAKFEFYNKTATKIPSKYP